MKYQMVGEVSSNLVVLIAQGRPIGTVQTEQEPSVLDAAARQNKIPCADLQLCALEVARYQVNGLAAG